MARRPNPTAVLGQKLHLLARNVAGRASASSASLSAAYGLPIEQVRKVLVQHGVRDDG